MLKGNLEFSIGRRDFLTYSFFGFDLFDFSLFGIFKKQENYDLIVVGGGHAGLAAAITARKCGLTVLVIEKRSRLGLNVLSDTGIFASSSNAKGVQNPGDSIERHAQDIYLGGGKKSDLSLAQAFAREAPEAIKWLTELGMVFEAEPFDSNSLYPRCFRSVHMGYMEVLQKEALRQGVEFAYEESADKILVEHQKISGVVVENSQKIKKQYRCHQLLLASGGFSANPELVRKNPMFKDVQINTRVGSDGRMIIAAQNIGAQIVGMDRVLCKPRPDDFYSQCYVHIDVAKVIYVNKKGERFVSEDVYRKELLAAFLRQLPDYVYEISDNAAVRSFSMDVQKDLWRGLEKGQAFKANSIEDLARALGIDPEGLQHTVKQYNRAVFTGIDEAFGKQKINLTSPLLEAPFWGVKVKMVVHESTGGIKVDPQCRVLDNDNKPIKGLLAAGAIVGNLHGENRLGGNGISSAICLGRIAGRTASRLEKA